ncbi:MAG: DUF4335 domain-containing protein [Microcoleaceae cyanobacterium]
MTIQRQYSLPNCKLVLQGLSDKKEGSSDTRPCLSMLMSAECRFVGYPQPLSGGREFFESLVKAVSQYTQGFLSGVSSPPDNTNSQAVTLQKVDSHLHRLTVQPQEEMGDKNQSPIQLDLTTVQLFDLVEAVDQFLADSRTLPELSLQLRPTSKRQVKPVKPTTQRVMPAAIGVSGLAVAALAFFLFPIPETQRPRELNPQQETSSELSDSPEATEGNSPPTDTNETNNSPTVVPITDPDTIKGLNAQLYEKIDQAWIDTPELDQVLVYRVSVNEQAEVVGYQAVGGTPADDIQQIPLPKLLRQPSPTPDSLTTEPLADFEVVFNPDGILEVRPWSEATSNNS